MLIVLTEPDNWSKEGIDALAALGDLRFGRDLRDADVVCLRVETRLDRAMLDSAPSLKVVVSPTTGLDHIDLATLEERGIKLISLKGAREFLDTITGTAEHVFALLLAVYRHVVPAHQAALDGRWDQGAFRGRTLAGKRLGIVGFGRLGQMVARIGAGFGMVVNSYDPFVPAASRRSLLELAVSSDVLSCNAEFNETTRGMINAEVFATLPSGAILINTARGAIVDESALITSLESGHLAGAGLDVLCNEDRMADNPVLAYARTHPNVVITPHIGGQTVESVREADLFVFEKLKVALRTTSKPQI